MIDDGSLPQKSLTDLQETVYAEEAGRYKAVVPVPDDAPEIRHDNPFPPPEKYAVAVSGNQADVQLTGESHGVAMRDAASVEILQPNDHAGWVLSGKKSLKENIEPLLNSHGWKLAWEIDHDFQVGMDAGVAGGITEIFEKIVDAYFKRGIFLKLTWFDGNRVLLVQQVFAEHEMREVANP